MKKTETEVLDIVKKELAVDKLDMDMVGQWDSLDIIQTLIALDTAYGEELKDIIELQTVKTPRELIDVLKSKDKIA